MKTCFMMCLVGTFFGFLGYATYLISPIALAVGTGAALGMLFLRSIDLDLDLAEAKTLASDRQAYINTLLDSKGL